MRGQDTAPHRLVMQRCGASNAQQVFSLIRESFPVSLLAFSVYQAAASCAYLRTVVCGNTRPRHTIILGMVNGALGGYYDALPRGASLFLNYIAVSPKHRGKGVGQALLRHFEAQGKRRGAPTLALDVFESNVGAVEWYLRNAYRLTSTSVVSRVRIRDCGGKGPGLVALERDWAWALAVEARRGFSKVNCRCGAGVVEVGLIGGSVVRILSHGGVDLAAAIRAIVGSRLASRSWLVYPGICRACASGASHSETVLRLVKGEVPA